MMQGRKKKKHMPVILAAAAILTLLPGCEGSPLQPEEPQWDIQADCCAVMEGVEVRGILSRSIEGLGTFTVTFPDEINGMQVQYRGGEYTVTFEGLAESVMGMEESVFGKLFSALEQGDRAELSWEDGIWAGTLSQGGRIMVSASEDGTITSLEVPVWQLQIRFAPKQTEGANEPL